MNYFLRAFILLATLLCTSCGAPKSPFLTLPSGHQVRIIGIGVMYFTEDKPAWWLKYETTVPIDNVLELRKEAQEAFTYYKALIDKSGRQYAAISANEPIPDKLVSKTRGYNFVWSKQKVGSWKLLK